VLINYGVPQIWKKEMKVIFLNKSDETVLIATALSFSFVKPFYDLTSWIIYHQSFWTVNCFLLFSFFKTMNPFVHTSKYTRFRKEFIWLFSTLLNRCRKMQVQYWVDWLFFLLGKTQHNAEYWIFFINCFKFQWCLIIWDLKWMLFHTVRLKLQQIWNV